MHITNAEAVALRRLLGHHMSVAALGHMGLLELSIRLANEPGCSDLGVNPPYDLAVIGRFRKGDVLTPTTLHHERRSKGRM